MSASTEALAQESDLPRSSKRTPWLLSSNRKLRHLQGIVVRNLVISPPSGRLRGNTIDDDNAPNALQTPAKALAKQESQSVHHSRSFANLKSEQASAPVNFKRGEKNERERNGDVQTKRRRATLPWSGVSPGVRQTRLEDIAENTMADTWFSLHCADIDDPVYVSEVVPKAVNPDFKAFDLNACGPMVSRSTCLQLKLWAKTGNMSEYVRLLELDVNMRCLQYIGAALESYHQPFPANCVIFRFGDGFYSALREPASLRPPSTVPKALADDAQLTSSYDALMRLANLDDCIQDALATRERLESQINAILEKNRPDLEVLSRKSQAEEKLSSVKRATTAARKQLRQSSNRKTEILESLKARRDAMAKGRAAQEKSQEFLSEAQTTLSSNEQLLKQNTEESTGQIRRICEDILSIYPIEPIPGKPLAFTIAGLPLPNSNFEDINKDYVAAALGYTAQVVYMLSFYLSIPLPYPVKPYLSNSFINDPISVRLPQRTFPLYPVNTLYRFEYGVFLLNKNIGYLMDRMGLRIFDIRHTLPNLKYLLYVLTAGTGELPARKAGGIRGLWAGRITPSLSRRGSEASTVSGDHTASGKRLQESFIKANGGLTSGRQGVTVAGPSTLLSPSSQQHSEILPLRLGGLEGHL